MFSSPFRLQRSDMSYREPDQYRNQTSWFWDSIGTRKEERIDESSSRASRPDHRRRERHAAFERQACCVRASGMTTAKLSSGGEQYVGQISGAAVGSEEFQLHHPR